MNFVDKLNMAINRPTRWKVTAEFKHGAPRVVHIMAQTNEEARMIVSNNMPTSIYLTVTNMYAEEDGV
jgi:hypothetical protein